MLVSPDGFDLFTDHNNLVFLFDPSSIVSYLYQTTLGQFLGLDVRLMRMSLHLRPHLRSRKR